MSEAGSIRVLVVDDHPMLREGIVAVIERQADMTVVGEASDGLEAIARFSELNPDVTLMDLQMPGASGFAAIEGIRARAPRAPILVLTTYPGDSQALRALKAGANGYLLKSCIRRELIDAIRAVHAGRRPISAEIAQEIAAHALDERLTDREVAILKLVAEGHPNKQVAWRLQVSTDTVKAHLKNIFAKLDVNDRTQAVIIAARRGYIDL
ncbi:MAG: response regulator transcription factor [Sphingomonas sp.]|uniref:response regulator n=1 Tax=Sphingomonas sp. TaxID=28214 RepID=UPI002614569B|nr:response regulator transcription factor [Sphingomonas sp.]MDK2768500.1 response regulator transcription factor [Sphingomonas sp.]